LIFKSFFCFIVPTLVQLLKDIDTAEEIIEYVQPYIGSVSKAKEFASDFISKRKQLSNAEVDFNPPPPPQKKPEILFFFLFSRN
jgi:hypothetical protein